MKTVLYTVKKGDTLPSIAAKFHASQSVIAERNNLKGQPFEGMKLIIDEQEAFGYTVRPFDSIRSIAAKFGISEESTSDSPDTSDSSRPPAPHGSAPAEKFHWGGRKNVCASLACSSRGNAMSTCSLSRRSIHSTAAVVDTSPCRRPYGKLVVDFFLLTM